MSTKDFTPQDIEVGHIYTHSDYPGRLWLGIGKREPFTFGIEASFSEKHLVLIASTPDDLQSIGLIFKTVDDVFGAWQSDWNQFRKISSLH
jgi:hypothetical protein